MNVRSAVRPEYLVSRLVNAGLEVFGHLSEGAGDAAGESRLVLMVDGGHLELVVGVKWSADRLEVGGAGAEHVVEDAVAPAVGGEGVGLIEVIAPVSRVPGQVHHLGVRKSVKRLDVHQSDFGWM